MGREERQTKRRRALAGESLDVGLVAVMLNSESVERDEARSPGTSSHQARKEKQKKKKSEEVQYKSSRYFYTNWTGVRKCMDLRDNPSAVVYIFPLIWSSIRLFIVFKS